MMSHDRDQGEANSTVVSNEKIRRRATATKQSCTHYTNDKNGLGLGGGRRLWHFPNAIFTLLFSCYAFSILRFQGLAPFHSHAILPTKQEFRGKRQSDDDRFRADSDTDTDTNTDTDDENEYFSACILWMDDNHRLEEWLAYHYYLLKLRYVVIKVDSKSVTSPRAIVDRWTGRNKVYKSHEKDHDHSADSLEYDLNMTIVVWNETDYLDPVKYGFEQAMIEVATGDKKHELANDFHLNSQRSFYKACSRHLISEREREREREYQQSQTQNGGTNFSNTNTSTYRASQWTTYYDTDEFLAFLPETSEPWKKYETPGYVLKRLNAAKKVGIRKEERRRTREFEEQQQKQQLANKDNNNENTIAAAFTDKNASVPLLSGASCLYIPRYKICSIELNEDETNELLNPPRNRNGDELASSSLDAMVPSEFVREKSLLELGNTKTNTNTKSNANGTTIVRRFDTLRYKYTIPGHDNHGKSILDLSQPDIRDAAAGDKQWSVHKVVRPICQDEGSRNYLRQRPQTAQTLIQREHMQLNHYVGSWESYNARSNDPRKKMKTNTSDTFDQAKSYANWRRKSGTTHGRESIVTRSWLKGFIGQVGGPRIAAHLLQDAGVIASEGSEVK